MTKQEQTRWKPGQSGNPNGRPPGSSEAGKLRADIEKKVPGIVAKLVEQAKEGDVQAARLLLERVLPPLRATEQPVPVQVPADASLTDQGRAVLQAAAGGVLTSSQASQLMAGLSSLARLVESDELARRVAALEDKHGKA
jgi:hypothetical protein